MRLNRPVVAMLHDTFMAAASFLISLTLRTGLDEPHLDWDALFLSIALFTGIAAVVFWLMGLYRGIWRYASATDLFAIVRAVTLTVVIFVAALFLVTRLEDFPRSVPLINWFVLIMLLGGPRLSYRFLKDGRFRLPWAEGTTDRRVPVLLVGSGDNAELFIRELNRMPQAGYRVVGIVDDKPGRVGRRIHTIEVMGEVSAMEVVVARLARRGLRPTRLVVTRPDLDPATLRALMHHAGKLGMSVATVPLVTQLAGERAQSHVAIQPIAIEDLLGRPHTVLDREAMRGLVAGRRVLITGAGGSIGGELARQVAALAPASLALLDSSEYLLYQIDLEIGERHPDLPREMILSNVRDRAHLGVVFAERRPEVVFHAAALKHVPMVEIHPSEGVLTNVAGTSNVAAACLEAGVDEMVLISTDKAINPGNVMGATKRLAEMICQDLDLRAAGTRFAIVRFGNVLGSTGSVVPLFERQLARGGPLTVTHPDVTRYFMTVREAVELVLQAAALARAEAVDRGGIFVLDMGEPVKIAEMARQMIRLAGLRPGKDVEILYTGLRPGEKLHEELFHPGEAWLATANPAIRVGRPRPGQDGDGLAERVSELVVAAEAWEDARVRALMRQLVPEFAPEAGAEPPAAARGA